MERKYFRLTLPLPESVNSYLRHKVSYREKKPIVVAYKTKEAIKFEEEAKAVIKNEIKKQNWIIPDKNTWVRVEAIWYVRNTVSDLSNLWKQTLDCMNGLVYLDDKKVIEATINGYVDIKNPRVELNIYTLQKKGIFLSDNHLDEFKKENCDECSKPSTCRILRTALENKITEDIDLKDNLCLKKKTKK